VVDAEIHVVGDEREQPGHVALGESGQHVVDGVEGGAGWVAARLL
jgi:hypothetical protein